MSADVYRGLVRETFRLRCTDAQFDAAYSDMFSPNPDVCPLPALLKPRYRVLLLSNTNELHANQFLRQFADVLAPFDALVLSYEVGIRKPDPHIYEHCRRLADRPASSACSSTICQATSGRRGVRLAGDRLPSRGRPTAQTGGGGRCRQSADSV